MCLEKMKAETDANQGQMKACREVIKIYLEKSDANWENLETKVKLYPESMEANQEKMEADQEELEANQEMTGAGVEHYNPAPCVKVKHLLTTLQGWTSMVYMEYVKE